MIGRRARFFLTVMVIQSAGCASAQTVAIDAAVPFASPDLVAWYTTEGQERLWQSRAKTDFFQLAHTYQPQINPLYCGIASSVMVLNAIRQGSGQAPSQADLEVALPEEFGGHRVPYPAYSQITFLGDQTDGIKPRDVIEARSSDVFDPGLTLTNLRDILRAYDLQADKFHASSITATGAADFRGVVQALMAEPDQFVLVNFKGKVIGAPTGGHISPVAAYDAASDSVLLLDVAGHKNPWYWVPVERLYTAMHTRDGDQYRGWIVVRDSGR